MSEGLVKIIIEITPVEKESRVKSFKKVMEFSVDYEDLPLRVTANSAKVVRKALMLAEEMCED
jgi:hypothetical protein